MPVNRVKHCWNVSAEQFGFLLVWLGNSYSPFLMVTFWGDVQVCGLRGGEDLPFPLTSWQFRFLGDFGKKLVINFEDIQMYFLAWILLIFMCIVILKQLSNLWEATDSVHKILADLFPVQLFISSVEVSAVQGCTTLNPSGSLSKHPHCLCHLSFPHCPQICVQQWQSK